eukprot:m.809085 g.809085  ORF g.809085 m.809085 type:complete len:1324 (+) comp23382_c0_seq5:240-4211(+)
MEALIDSVCNAGMKDRIDVANKLMPELTSQSKEIKTGDAGRLVGTLVEWLKANNYKICLSALDALSALMDMMPHAFKSHTVDFITSVHENFSDAHENVREQCTELLLKAMHGVIPPQIVFDHISSGFAHKVPRVRQHTLLLVKSALEIFGDKSLNLNSQFSKMAQLLSDRDEGVRDASIRTLAEYYRNVGERVRRDLQRVDGIPANRLTTLFEKFDEVQQSGTMVQRDEGHVSRSPMRTHSPRTTRRSLASSSGSSASRHGSAASSGGVDPGDFAESMFDCEAEYVESEKDLQAEVREFVKYVSDSTADWEKRVATCKRLRGLVKGNAVEFSSFVEHMRDAAATFAAGVSDLRSQVSKETCITVSQLSTVLQNKFEPIAKSLIPVLLQQATINVKVLAQSAALCLEHVVRTCRSPRIITVLASAGKDHKSVSARRQMHVALELIVSEWEADVLKRQLSTVVDLINRGQLDADAGVRTTARTTYWRLQPKFPAAATEIMNKLDASKQKHLLKAKTSAASSSSTASSRPPLARGGGGRNVGRTASATSARLKATSPTGSHHGSRNTSTSSEDDVVPAGRGSGDGSARSGARSPRPLSTSGPLRVALNSSQEIKQPRSGTGGGMDLPQRVRPVYLRGGGGGGGGDSTNTLGSSGGPRRVQTASSSSSGAASRRHGNRASTAPSHASRPPHAQPKTVTQRLSDAIELAAGGDSHARIDAAEGIKAVVKSDAVARLDIDELKLVSNYFIAHLAERNADVLLAVLDVLSAFITACHEDLALSWIRDCTFGLLSTLGNDLSPTLQDKVRNVLDLMRTSFDTDVQMLLNLKMLSTSKKFSTPEAVVAHVQFIAKLLPKYSPEGFQKSYDSNELDCLSAVQRLAEYSTDLSHPELRKAATNVIVLLFKVNPVMFADIVTKLPRNGSGALRRALNSSSMDWESILEQAQGGTNGDNSGFGSTLIPKSSTEAFDIAVMEGLNDLDMDDELDDPSAAANDAYNPTSYEDWDSQHGHSQSSSPSRVSPAMSPPSSVASPSIAGGGVSARSPAGDRLPPGLVLPREQSLSPSSHIPVAAMGAPSPHSIHASPIGGPVDVGHNADAVLLLELTQLFRDGSPALTTQMVVDMLRMIVDAVRVQDHVFWDAHFSALAAVVLGLLDHDDAAVRDLALRALRQMLKQHTKYFGPMVETVVRKLLERHRETDRDVLRSAEETLSVLSNTVSAAKCVLILRPIILNEDGPVLLAAIKLVTKVLKKLSMEELESLLEHIVPGMIKGYNHTMAEVRKGVVFCLVEIHLILGDALTPHLGALSSSQKKLLGIYIKRAEDRLREQTRM